MDNTPQNNPGDFMPWSVYWPKYPQFFANKEAASHFLQTRKRAMTDAGVLLEASRGYIVHEAKLDGMLLGLLTNKPSAEMTLRGMARQYVTLAECGKAIAPEQSFIEFMAFVNALPEDEQPQQHGAYNAGGQVTFNLPEAIRWCARMTKLMGA